MYFLTQIAVDQASSPFSIALVLVGIGGFVAAVSIGSIAWYNSKRPQGWENKDRPEIVPRIDK